MSYTVTGVRPHGFHHAQQPSAVRRAVRFIITAGRACRYLWAVRAAIPWPVRVLLAVAMLVKCLPLDMGADELLTAVAVLILNRLRPGLVRACWRAAQVRA